MIDNAQHPATAPRSVVDAVDSAVRRIPPAWPLSAAVAVNPFLGRDSLAPFLDREENRTAIAELRDRGVDPEPTETAADTETADALSGLTFVFTGSLSVTRGEAQAHVEAHGASATSSVSGNTDYLVAGENPGRSKRDDAAAEDVPVVDEDGFGDLLADRGVDWPPTDD
mgnify:CR=1 FL=1